MARAANSLARYTRPTSLGGLRNVPVDLIAERQDNFRRRAAARPCLAACWRRPCARAPSNVSLGAPHRPQAGQPPAGLTVAREQRLRAARLHKRLGQPAVCVGSRRYLFVAACCQARAGTQSAGPTALRALIEFRASRASRGDSAGCARLVGHVCGRATGSQTCKCAPTSASEHQSSSTGWLAAGWQLAGLAAGRRLAPWVPNGIRAQINRRPARAAHDPLTAGGARHR